VVSAVGELDLATAEPFEQKLAEVLERGSGTRSGCG
jgi:anti-anti-sigma regulatory factor